MINSRSLDDLSLPIRLLCQEHVRGCAEAGIELLVTSTYRDNESQAALYAIGRTKEVHRSKVTNAQPGQSWHNFRAAYDVVPLVGGKASWEDRELWKEVIRIGKAVGLEAGADFKSFPDIPHFQLRNGLTLIQAADRFRENGTIYLP